MCPQRIEIPNVLADLADVAEYPGFGFRRASDLDHAVASRPLCPVEGVIDLGEERPAIDGTLGSRHAQADGKPSDLGERMMLAPNA